jgi:hypothetical protein
MKKYIITIILMLPVLTAAIAQEMAIGDTSVINNHSITKVSGGTKGYGYTKIEYQTQAEILKVLKVTAESEMWDAKTKKEEFDYTQNYEKGGAITLRIGRLSIDAANTEWYTIICKKGTTEVFRKQLKAKLANVPRSDDLWWNIKITSIPMLIKPPFDVFVVEAGGDKVQYRVLN